MLRKCESLKEMDMQQSVNVLRENFCRVREDYQYGHMMHRDESTYVRSADLYMWRPVEEEKHGLKR